MFKHYKYLAALNISVPNYEREITFDNLIIRKRTKEELLKFYHVENIELDSYGGLQQVVSNENEPSGVHWMLNDSSGLNCEYYIEYESEKEDWDFRLKVSNIVRAFRIYKEGKIEVPIIYETTLKHFQNTKPRIVKEEKLFVLKLNELPEIFNLFKKIEKINNNKFSLIIERFDNAVSITSSVKNAYVDLVGIIESIFLQNQKDELRFRFSLLLANLLNILGEEITFQKARSIYDIRSQLAHTGDSKDFNDNSFFELLKYSRIIIKWYIENNLNDGKAQDLLFDKISIKY